MKTIKTKTVGTNSFVQSNQSTSVGTNLFVQPPQSASVGANSFAQSTKKVRINSYPQNQTRQPRANLSHPRLSTLVLALAAAFALPNHPAHAAPLGGQVVAGQATISQPNANTTTITQSTAKAIIDWQSFSIAAHQHTQFIQPSAASVTLNRVVGVDPSQILGRLTANGQVFLVNPNGIYFGKNAQIDVAGLIATTHNIRNADFLAGNYTFNIAGKAGAAVINDGMIHIADTGIAAFVAPSVANRGVIVARLGKVMLASANGFTLDFSGDQLISFLVNDQVAQTAFDLQGTPLTSFVENAGQIQAQGGYVLLTAKAAENAIHSVINQTGSIEAVTVGTHNGTIILNAGTGSLNVAGTLDASASPSPTAGLPSPASGRGAGGEGNGGFIETSGAHVKIDPNAKITTAAPFGKAGTWLIDPVDFIIAATGGDITGTQLAARLANSNIEIQTLPTGTGNGDIFVNDAVTWGSFNELILTAHRNVNVNSLINATGGGSVRLRADSLGTGVGTVNFAGTGHINANNGAAVGIYYNPVSYTDALTKSDATGNPYSNNVTLGAGAAGMTAYMLVNDVNKLQAINTNLSGNYALGKNIDATATATWNAGAGFVPIGDSINLFNSINQFTGILNGQFNTVTGLFINTTLTPLVTRTGMFVVNAGTIQNLGLMNVNITGSDTTGTLASMNTGLITDSYVTGTVTGAWTVGGLVADNTGMYGATLNPTAATYTGVISRSYSNVTVTGTRDTGGLVGANGSVISDSYATGSVNGMTSTRWGAPINFGSLVGIAYGNSQISNSFATGSVAAGVGGGLVGSLCNVTVWCPPYFGSVVTNSYWNTQTVGQADAYGLNYGTGLTTAQMQQQANFTGWDFVNTWQIAPNAYPTLKAFTPPPTAQIITPTPPVTPPVVTPPTLTPAQALLVQQHQGDSTFQLLLAISQGLFTNSNTDPVWVGLYQNGAATANQIAANTQRNIYDAYTAADIFAQIRAGTLVNNTLPTNTNWRVIYRNGQATAAQVAANALDNAYVKYQIASATTLFNGLVTTKDISTSPTATNAVVWNALVSNNTANANAAKRMWDTYNLYKNADGATLLQGIYAKSFKNDPTDPIWRAMYLNGSPSPAQLQANLLWNIDVANQAALAQAAADAAKAMEQAKADAAKAVDKAIADARAMTRPLSPDPRAVLTKDMPDSEVFKNTHKNPGSKSKSQNSAESPPNNEEEAINYFKDFGLDKAQGTLASATLGTLVTVMKEYSSKSNKQFVQTVLGPFIKKISGLSALEAKKYWAKLASEMGVLGSLKGAFTRVGIATDLLFFAIENELKTELTKTYGQGTVAYEKHYALDKAVLVLSKASISGVFAASENPEAPLLAAEAAAVMSYTADLFQYTADLTGKISSTLQDLNRTQANIQQNQSIGIISGSYLAINNVANFDLQADKEAVVTALRVSANLENGEAVKKIVDVLYEAQASITKNGAAGFKAFVVKLDEAKKIATEYDSYNPYNTHTQMVTNLIQELIIQNAKDLAAK